MPAPKPPEATIQLDPLIERVITEIREAETEVAAKTAELATAREKLAAARGKMDLIGQLQQMTMNGQAAPE